MKGDWTLEQIDPLLKAIISRFEALQITPLVCGSIRRGRTEGIGDVDLVVPTSWYNVDKALASFPNLIRLPDNKGVRVYSHNEIQFKVFRCSPLKLGSSQMQMTGPLPFLRWIRARAKEQFMTLHQHGLFHNGNLIASKTEELIFSALGLEFIPPEGRDWSTNYEADTFERNRKQELRSRSKANAVLADGSSNR